MWHQIRPHRKCPPTHKLNHFGDHVRLHFRSRFLGPPKKKVAGPGSLPPEVRLFLTWARYLIRRGYGPTKSIWINLDESALPIHVGGRFGNVVMLGKEQKTKFATRGTLHERRKNVTLVASVCTDRHLQTKLPQFLLPNITGKKKVWTAAKGRIPDTSRVVIIPDTSGWINTAKLMEMVKQIATVAKEHAPTKKIVLVWDAHPAHVAPLVLRHAKKHGLRVLVIPSKLTHLLQVLDFSVFAQFKKNMYEAQVHHQIHARCAQMDMATWIDSTVAAIDKCLPEFDAAGHFRSAGQWMMTGPYRQALACTLPPTWETPARMLTQTELNLIVGRNLKGIHVPLFGAMPPIDEAPRPAAEGPLKRLRSKTCV